MCVRDVARGDGANKKLNEEAVVWMGGCNI
jgi:hypothetical protein